MSILLDMASAETATTGLERALAATDGPPRPAPRDALAVARERWLAGERLDMGALAKELGISRATLYTWVGSKERLLGEVIWSFAEAGVREARAAATGTGPEYVVDVVARFTRLNASFEPLRAFISEDPQLALRLLTSKEGPIQERMIAVARQLLSEQIDAGRLKPALDLETLSYLMVRVSESFLYSDLITGTEPDVEKADQVIRVLLGVDPNG
jgi:AcrR family transcriptional regulator